MSYTTTEEFGVLHALRVRGLSTAEPLAEATGIAQSEVQKILDDAVARGLARSRTGRVHGYMLTGDGRERHSALHPREVSDEQHDALLPAYEAFLEPNRRFKTLTTQWQTEGAGDTATVLSALQSIHAELVGLLKTAADTVARMGRYQPRFEAALGRFAAGDQEALAKPLSGSYHDVWMELHEDLLVMLGRERTAEDG